MDDAEVVLRRGRSAAVSEHSFSELVARPSRGRVFTGQRRPGLGDCSPSGRMRLDALARWLQDIAYFDVEEAGLASHAVWVVRRSRISVRRFPRFDERHRLLTFCSGLGRMWAERRTTIERDGDDQPVVEAVSLWVHLDPATWRPVPFTPEEIATYGEAAEGRRITARLRHPQPPSLEPHVRWRFRAVDCDVADHINNAAYLEPLEEASGGSEPDAIDVEIEYRTPAQPGEQLFIRTGERRWLVSPQGETHASIAIARTA